MKTITKTLSLLFLCIAFAAILPATPLDVTYTGQTSVVAHGSYVGPYNITIDSDPFSAICIDKDVQIPASKAWQANIVALPQTPEFLQAAWLAEQFAVEATSKWGAIHGAIWNLFGASIQTSAVTGWLAASVGQTPTNSWSLLVPTGAVNSQRMLISTPPGAETPEPSTFAMLGLGALLVVLSKRVRRS